MTLLVLLLFPSVMQAQVKVETLEKKLSKATDKEEVDLMTQLADLYIYKDIQSSFNYGLKALQKAKRLKYKQGIMAAQNAIGNAHLYRAQEGDLTKSFRSYKSNTNQSPTAKGQLLEKAKALNGMANLYYQWTDYQKALEYNMQALKIRDKLNDDRGRARSYNALGNIYDALGDHENAVKNYSKALNIYEQLKSKRDIAGVLNNLASSIQVQIELSKDPPQYDQVIQYYTRALKIYNKLKDQKGIALIYSNLGTISYAQNDFEKAIKFFNKALQIEERYPSQDGNASILNNIALVYKAKQQNELALEYFNMAATSANEKENKVALQFALQQMSMLFDKMGMYSEAYQHANAASQLKDQISQGEVARQASIMQSRYEVERNEKRLKEQEIKTAEAELKAAKSTRIIYWVLSGVLLIGLIALWLYYRFNVSKKLNKQLSEKNKEISNKSASLKSALEKLAESKENLMDSILYARHIQSSILPSKKEMFKGFDSGFVMNKPKDVVSGDFYWFAENENRKLVVLSDCTGHGVPGAFMTIMGNTLLNEIVNGGKIFEPDQILYQLDEKIKSVQASGNKKFNDGMDIVIALFDFSNNTVKYAGAKSHLHKIENKELKTYKGSKYSIGNDAHYKGEKVFDLHEMPFQKGDVFYMFSDGIQDQFGGEDGRKFMIKRLRDLLVSVHYLDVEKQQIQVGKGITMWKQNEPQTDDMMLIGLKI